MSLHPLIEQAKQKEMERETASLISCDIQANLKMSAKKMFDDQKTISFGITLAQG